MMWHKVTFEQENFQGVLIFQSHRCPQWDNKRGLDSSAAVWKHRRPRDNVWKKYQGSSRRVRWQPLCQRNYLGGSKSSQGRNNASSVTISCKYALNTISDAKKESCSPPSLLDKRYLSLPGILPPLWRKTTIRNTGQLNYFTETAVTPEQKVEKSFPRSEINRHAES